MYNFQDLIIISYDNVGNGDFLPLVDRNNYVAWQGDIESLGANYKAENLAIANYNGFINISASLDIETIANALFQADNSLTPYEWSQKLETGNFVYNWTKGRKHYLEEQWITEYETFATKEDSSTGLIEDFPFYFSETLDPIRVVCEFWDHNGEKIFDVTKFFSIISERSLINLVRAEPLEGSPEIIKPSLPLESPYKKVFKLAEQNDPEELQWFAFDTYSEDYAKDQNQKRPSFSVTAPDKPESSEVFRFFYFWLNTNQSDFIISDLSRNNFSNTLSKSSISAISQRWDVSRRNFDYIVDEENREASKATYKNDNSTDNDDRGKYIFVVIKETWATINPSIDGDTSAGEVFGGGTVGDYSDFVKYETDSKYTLHVNGYTRKFVDISLTNVYAAVFYNPYKVFKVYNGLTNVIVLRKIFNISQSGEFEISKDNFLIPDISNPSTIYTFDLSDPSCKNLSFNFGSSPGASNYSEDSCWSSILDGPDCFKEIGPQGGDDNGDGSSFSLIELLTPPPLAKSMFAGFYTSNQDNFSNSSYSNPSSFYYNSSSNSGPIQAVGSRVIDVCITSQNEDNTVDKETIGVYMDGAKNGTIYIGREQDFVIFDQSHYSNSGLSLSFNSINSNVPSPIVYTFGTPGDDGRTTFVPTQPKVDKTPVLVSGYEYVVPGVGGGYIGPPIRRNYGSVVDYVTAPSYINGLPWNGDDSYNSYYNKLPDMSWAAEYLQRPKLNYGNMGPHSESDSELQRWSTARTAGSQPAIYIDGAAFKGPTPFISYNITNRDSFGKLLNPYIEITLTGKISPFEIPQNNFNTQVTFDNILGQHQDIYNQCYNAENIAIVVNGTAHVKFGDVYCKSVSFEEGTWTDYSNFRAEFSAAFASGDYSSFSTRPNFLYASGLIDDYDISSSITHMDEYSYMAKVESSTLNTLDNAQSPGVYQEVQRAKISFKPYVRDRWEDFNSLTSEETKTRKRQKTLYDEVKKVVDKANSQFSGPLYSGVLDFPVSQNSVKGPWRYNKKSNLNYNHTLGVYEWERTSILAPPYTEYLTNISVNIDATNTDNNFKVTVNGSILGLSVWNETEIWNNSGSNTVFQPPSSGLAITNARDGLAWLTNNYQYGLESYFYKKASDQTSYLLNPSPETVTLKENPTKGSIDFSITYGVKPLRYFSGSVSENITVNDIMPGDMFNLVQVMGRANGPMIQDLHTRTEYRRELNIEVVLHTAALPRKTSSLHTYEENKGAFRNSKPTLSTSFQKELNRLLQIYSPASEPGILKYYQMPPSESWSPLDGRYTCKVTWVYELGS